MKQYVNNVVNTKIVTEIQNKIINDKNNEITKRSGFLAELFRLPQPEYQKIEQQLRNTISTTVKNTVTNQFITSLLIGVDIMQEQYITLRNITIDKNFIVDNLVQFRTVSEQIVENLADTLLKTDIIQDINQRIKNRQETERRGVDDVIGGLKNYWIVSSYNCYNFYYWCYIYSLLLFQISSFL